MSLIKQISFPGTGFHTIPVDVSKFIEVFGRARTDDKMLAALPGVNGSQPTIHGVKPGEEISMLLPRGGKFRMIQISRQINSAQNHMPIDLVFSRKPNDFVGDIGDPGCARLRMYPGDFNFLRGHSTKNFPPNAYFAELNLDVDNFMNLRLSDGVKVPTDVTLIMNFL